MKAYYKSFIKSFNIVHILLISLFIMGITWLSEEYYEVLYPNLSSAESSNIFLKTILYGGIPLISLLGFTKLKSDKMNSLDLLRSDFLLFYKDENAKITDTPDYTISFTNLADTTNLLNLLKGADDSVSNNPITDIQDEIVKIPDTAKNVPYILYIFGIGVFLAGAVIIAKVLRQPKKGV